MNFQIRWTIKIKLLALIGATLIGAQSIVAVFSVWQEAQRYVALKHATLASTAQVMATATARAAAAGDARAARDALRAIAKIDDVHFVAALTAEGHPLADLGASELLSSDIHLQAGDPPPGLFDLMRAHAIQYTTPILLEGRTVGRIEVIGETRDFNDRIFAALTQTLWGGGLALVLALLISGRLQASITGPLTALAQTMSRVRRSHDYSAELPSAGRDEIGQLVSSFNAMIGEIGARDRKLASYAEGLERQVAERTEDYRQARDSAETANRAKSDFLATMSHEIRTPMNGVLVMAELLAASDLAPRAKRQAEIIARSGQSLLAIINDILDFSKIEAGKLEVERLPVDPTESAETALSLFHEKAQSKGLDLAAVFAPGLRAPVAADPVRLGQVIGNLVNNALKFTEKGDVQVLIGPDPADSARVLFAVRDTGVGIAADKLDSVFGAFEQADQSTTRKYGGTGLGLAISRKLVAAMGGDLRVDSKLGEGATFHFSLPLADTAKGLDIPRLSEARRLVLQVAGAATQEALAVYFAQAGFAVERLASDAGWAEMSERDLLIIDAKSLRAAPRRPGAGAIVALADLGDGGGERMIESGLADYVLQKPLSLPELGLIAAALRDDRPLREYRRATRDLGDLPQFPGKKLLVADDNPVNREVAATALQRFGVEIDLVEDGVQALAAIGRQTYDLVLMDCSMPEMDGFEATRRVRAMETEPGAARLPIVALTAHVVGSGAEAWRDAGMDGVLHKPFTMRDLGDCLATWFGDGVVERVAAAPAEPDDETPVLDPAVTGQLRDLAAAGKPEFLRRVCGLYRQHAPDSAAQLHAGLAAGDLDAIGRLAHSLKSMSYNMGASRVAAAALELERRARENGLLPEAEALAALDVVIAEALSALDQLAPAEAA